MKRTIRLAAGLVAAASLTAACGRTHLTSPPARIPMLRSGGAAAVPASIPALGSGGAEALPGMAFPGKVEYRVQGTLPALAASAPASTLGETASDAQVERLAAALGLHGAMTSTATGWTVGTVSTKGSVLDVARSGGLPWAYLTTGVAPVISLPACAVPPSPAQAVQSIAEPAAPRASAGSGSVVLRPCPLPAPVAGLPTEAQAEQLVRTDFAAAGLDLDGATVEATGGLDVWYVTVTPAVDGVPVGGATWTATVLPHGTLLSASGWLASPVSAGDYPLVGVQAGLDRLRQGGWVMTGVPDIAVPLVGVSGTANASTTAAPPPQAVGGSAGSALSSPAMPPGSISSVPPVVHPGMSVPPVLPPARPVTPAEPVAPVAPMPTTTLTVTGVHLGLAWAVPASAPAGAQAWLVPVYVFELQGGGSVPVLAVSAKFVSPPSEVIAP